MAGLSTRRLTLVTASVAGALSAHELTYRLLGTRFATHASSAAGPGHAHHDSGALFEMLHGWLDVTGPATLVLVAVGTGMLVVGAACGRWARLSGKAVWGAAAASSLGLVAVEWAERVAAGAPLSDLGAVLGVGVPLVATAAIAAVLVLRAAEIVVRRAVQLWRHADPLRRSSSAPRPALRLLVPSLPGTAQRWRSRAPPLAGLFAI